MHGQLGIIVKFSLFFHAFANIFNGIAFAKPESICDPLVAPYLGYIIGNCSGLLVGDTCIAHCHEAYKLSGPSHRVCNGTSRSWIPEKPQMCLNRKKKCRRIHPPTYGYFRGKCYDNVGAMCDMQCRPGYEIIGAHTRYCTVSGTWEPSHPRCQRQRCPILRNPEHGKIIGTCDNYVRSTCRFSCDEGYLLLGSRIRKCTALGIWDGEQTRCVKACPPHPPLQYGGYLGGCVSGLYSEICRVRCKRGYRLEPNQSFIKCKNGTWSSPAPKCKPIECEALPSLPGGTYEGYCSPGSYGKACLFSCDDSHSLIGRSSVYCRYNGKWSSPVPTCLPKAMADANDKRCPDIEPRHIYNLQGKCQNAKPEEICQISCLEPNSLDSGNHVIITCLDDGKWSSGNLTCDTSAICCPPPRKPKKGFILNCESNQEQAVGTICEQSCDVGFEPVSGTRTLICMPTGEWEGTRLFCRKKTGFAGVINESGKTIGVNGSIIKGMRYRSRRHKQTMVLKNNKIHIKF